MAVLKSIHNRPMRRSRRSHPPLLAVQQVTPDAAGDSIAGGPQAKRPRPTLAAPLEAPANSNLTVDYDSVRKKLLDPSSWTCMQSDTTADLCICVACGHICAHQHAEEHSKSKRPRATAKVGHTGGQSHAPHAVFLQMNGEFDVADVVSAIPVVDNHMGELALLKETLNQVQTLDFSRPNHTRRGSPRHFSKQPGSLTADQSGRDSKQSKRNAAAKTAQLLAAAAKEAATPATSYSTTHARNGSGASSATAAAAAAVWTVHDPAASWPPPETATLVRLAERANPETTGGRTQKPKVRLTAKTD